MLGTSRKLVAVTVGGAIASLASGTAALAGPDHAGRRSAAPVNVTVFSPGAGDLSGSHGVGFIVDLALDATNAQGNTLLSAHRGYKPFFNAPVTASGQPDPHTGPDAGAPGLVVLLSSTPDRGVNSPFHGPRTNLAGLFQINGVARVHGLMETWNTWQPQKPIFGQHRKVTLTVYVVSGTAPEVAAAHPTGIISNTVTVPFTVAGS